MIALLLIPLVLPFATAILARRTVEHLPPAAALWALTATTTALAGSSVFALGFLMLPGLLKVPAIATLEEMIHPLDVAPDTLLLPAAAASVGALTVGAWVLLRSALRQVDAFRSAKTQADARLTAGDLCVIDTPHPDAYALPGRPGRIVVTTGMLRRLTPAEREALLAHERAHLAGHHHYHLALAEIAAHCHPGLRQARTAIRLAVERVADEAAAGATGDRRLTAQAIGRAALATRREATNLPSFTPSFAAGPVPQRVAALLHAPARRPRVALAVGGLLVLLVGGSVGGAVTGAVDMHRGVEIAQGEDPDD